MTTEPSGETVPAEGLAAALRRIDALTYDRGHRFNPIDPESLGIIQRANASDPRSARSERCWDCRAEWDQPVDPFNAPDGPTWGDKAHDLRAEWDEARSLLSRNGRLGAQP